jgi:hypothetical protein
MKTATVADLGNKRGRAFATLTTARERPALPPLNRMARLEKAFPDGPVAGDSRDTVDYDRGDR